MADIDYEGLALLSPSERSVVLAKIRSEESKKQKWSIIMDKFQKGILRNKKGKLVTDRKEAVEMAYATFPKKK
jgi:hypothetical protein